MEIDDKTRDRVGNLILAVDGFFAIAGAVGCDPDTAKRILEEEMTKAQATLHLDGLDAVVNAQARLLNKT